jgi:hypothetical protein
LLLFVVVCGSSLLDIGIYTDGFTGFCCSVFAIEYRIPATNPKINN